MPVIKQREQRVGVFLDVQNLYHSAKHLYHGGRVNFKELLKAAVAGRKLIRALAYVVKTETVEEQAFFEALTKSGIELKIKDLQVFPGGLKKGDWDVGLAVDTIRLAPALDAVVLVSGDGDFVPLLEYLKNSGGVQVEVMAFGRSASARLREAADEFVDLSEDPDKFIIPAKPKSYTGFLKWNK